MSQVLKYLIAVAFITLCGILTVTGTETLNNADTVEVGYPMRLTCCSPVLTNETECRLKHKRANEEFFAKCYTGEKRCVQGRFTFVKFDYCCNFSIAETTADDIGTFVCSIDFKDRAELRVITRTVAYVTEGVKIDNKDVSNITPGINTENNVTLGVAASSVGMKSWKIALIIIVVVLAAVLIAIVIFGILYYRRNCIGDKHANIFNNNRADSSVESPTAVSSVTATPSTPATQTGPVINGSISVHVQPGSIENPTASTPLLAEINHCSEITERRNHCEDGQSIELVSIPAQPSSARNSITSMPPLSDIIGSACAFDLSSSVCDTVPAMQAQSQYKNPILEALQLNECEQAYYDKLWNKLDKSSEELKQMQRFEKCHLKKKHAKLRNNLKNKFEDSIEEVETKYGSDKILKDFAHKTAKNKLDGKHEQELNKFDTDVNDNPGNEEQHAERIRLQRKKLEVEHREASETLRLRREKEMTELEMAHKNNLKKLNQRYDQDLIELEQNEIHELEMYCIFHGQELLEEGKLKKVDDNETSSNGAASGRELADGIQRRPAPSVRHSKKDKVDNSNTVGLQDVDLGIDRKNN